MKTNETETMLPLETLLPIRAVSGGERGQKDSGKQFNYTISKAMFLALIGEVFDKEVGSSNAENAKSGGAVSQFLHSYGATHDKMTKADVNPFPEDRATFEGENMERWLEVMEFKAPRTSGPRKTAEEVTIEAILTTLSVPGITWAMLAPVYPAITEAKIEAYKVKMAAKVE